MPPRRRLLPGPAFTLPHLTWLVSASPAYFLPLPRLPPPLPPPYPAPCLAFALPCPALTTVRPLVVLCDDQGDETVNAALCSRSGAGLPPRLSLPVPLANANPNSNPSPNPTPNPYPYPYPPRTLTPTLPLLRTLTLTLTLALPRTLTLTLTLTLPRTLTSTLTLTLTLTRTLGAARSEPRHDPCESAEPAPPPVADAGVRVGGARRRAAEHRRTDGESGSQ